MSKFHKAKSFNQSLRDSIADIDEIQLERVLRAKIEGYQSWEKCDKDTDKRGADIVIHRIGNRRSLYADIKNRDVDPIVAFGRDDLFIETLSCRETGAVGWARDHSKITDLLIFLFPTGRGYVLSFRKLLRVMDRHWESWRTAATIRVQRTWNSRGGYTSECLLCSRQLIESAIRNLRKFRRYACPRMKRAA